MIDTIFQKYLDANQVISTDSRNIPKGCIFFALKGELFNGNQYAKEALKNGALCAIIDEPEYQCNGAILVENVLITLQKLANHYRSISTFKVIALTGTNGKTTTKELMHKVLSKVYNCHATTGNFNNHIGVPLTILSTPQDTEILVVEMGANHQGEIKDLCAIAEPDAGLITNIGKAHLEGFGGYQGVIIAKSELYDYLKTDNKTIFVNTNIEVLKNLTTGLFNTVKYGENNSTCYLKKVNTQDTLELELAIKNNVYFTKSNLFGTYNAENILAAATIGDYFDVPPSKIVKAIEEYLPENNRSQIKKTKKNTLVLDSYNANPSSMKYSLQSFENMMGNKKTVILGEMKELGQDSILEHENLVAIVNTMSLTEYHFVGEEFSKLKHTNTNFYASTQDLIKYLKSNPINESLVFIKGSRSNKLEELIDYL